MERTEAHRVLTEHLPVPDRRWLGWRLRCADCGTRYPCATRQAALDELAARFSSGRQW
jgi:hypothetical protein